MTTYLLVPATTPSTGGKGNDYLEGGAGNNTYRFDYGDGRDVIVDNGALGESNQLLITHKAGGVASPVTRLALIVAGGSNYQELDAAGNVINASTTYYTLVSGSVAGQQDLRIDIDGGAGGTITIENWGGDSNQFGIAVSTPTIAVPELPVTVNGLVAPNGLDSFLLAIFDPIEEKMAA